MIMKSTRFILFVLSICLGTLQATAQCDEIATQCEKHINQNYISDGQAYRALLSGSDVAEFQTTLFGGNTYRIAACSGMTDGNLIFRIFDQEKNLLFSNYDFSDAPYWDFNIDNSMPVIIEATLDETKSESGCAVIVIGFKR
jgi:hypothetical protein